jgi:hypothetical protein
MHPTKIALAGETIELRELPWSDAKRLFSSLALLNRSEPEPEALKVLALLSAAPELCSWLVLKSTGKDEAWLAARSPSEVLDLALAAAELHVQLLRGAVSKLAPLLQEAFTKIAAGQTLPPAMDTRRLDLASIPGADDFTDN